MVTRTGTEQATSWTDTEAQFGKCDSKCVTDEIDEIVRHEKQSGKRREEKKKKRATSENGPIERMCELEKMIEQIELRDRRRIAIDRSIRL